MERRIRTMILNEETLCYCNSCDDFLPCDKFGINTRNHWGRNHDCKTCAKKKANLRENPDDLPVGQRELTKLFLRRLGYDLDSELSVHQQFLIKHDL